MIGKAWAGLEPRLDEAPQSEAMDDQKSAEGTVPVGEILGTRGKVIQVFGFAFPYLGFMRYNLDLVYWCTFDSHVELLKLYSRLTKSESLDFYNSQALLLCNQG